MTFRGIFHLTWPLLRRSARMRTAVYRSTCAIERAPVQLVSRCTERLRDLAVFTTQGVDSTATQFSQGIVLYFGAAKRCAGSSEANSEAGSKRHTVDPIGTKEHTRSTGHTIVMYVGLLCVKRS